MGPNQSDSPARLSWTKAGKRSLKELVRYLAANEYGDPASRAREIARAVRKLTHLPSRCPVVSVRNGKAIRRFVVSERYLVFYVYFSPRGVGERGRVSVRAVSHGAKKRPFAGVREQDALAYVRRCEAGVYRLLRNQAARRSIERLLTDRLCGARKLWH